MKALNNFTIPKNLADFAGKSYFNLIVNFINDWKIDEDTDRIFVYLYLNNSTDTMAMEKQVFAWVNTFPKTLEESFDMWLAMQETAKENPTRDDYIPYCFKYQRDYDNYIKMMEGKNNGKNKCVD